MTPELQQLNQMRLDRDWSFQALAEEMEREGTPVPATTLYALLTNPPDRPYERTLHKIRKFLATQEPAVRRRSGR